ncbi:hypothetical protein CXB51_014084 [Gossypium anomalum]|uniref:Reverse transcriptase n=1 Tax=Gossypium anomalum TaxID=47600 RepID=A0A8J5YK42_9ROSI|nr:hypothetical protein CXB51_014084 [Gossypium anomalum]
MAELVFGPWVIAGDFNSILEGLDRMGGVDVTQIRCQWFQYFIFNNELHELGFYGPQITWSRGNLSQHLDRVVCNLDWESFALNYVVRHLHCLKFDHWSILVSLCVLYERSHQSFRCLARWMMHAEFNAIIKGCWKNNIEFPKIGTNASMVTFLYVNRIRQEVEDVLKHEELLWFQKSRMMWLSNGDKNTRYFRSCTLARQKMNKIEGLKIGIGIDEWGFYN